MAQEYHGRLIEGRYLLIGTIGEGGMADVYMALDQRLQRVVAVKLLKPGYAANPDMRERFVQEGRVIARLTHPHIVALYDTGYDTGDCYHVIEYLPRGSARELLNSRRFEPDAVIEIGIAIGRGLAAAHRRQLVHRDVKPANILFTQDGMPKLADFGIARRIDQSGRTLTGVILGTPDYVAPEVINGRPATAASDIYGLGVTLYTLATGQPPFSGDDDTVLIKHLSEIPKPPSVLMPDIPPQLDALILRALAKDPTNRYPSADAFADALLALKAPQPLLRSCLLLHTFVLIVLAIMLVLALVQLNRSVVLRVNPAAGAAGVQVQPAKRSAAPCPDEPDPPRAVSGGTLYCVATETLLLRIDRVSSACLIPGDYLERRRRMSRYDAGRTALSRARDPCAAGAARNLYRRR
ncbi:MAG: serine/threonine protein kinase [Oscillochloris sp.]|nr:serine/threonine protein kinase [Oscillochloris sp.]